VRSLILLAAGLEVLMGSAGFLIGGAPAGAAALIGASLATGAQIAAVVLLRPAMQASQGQFQQRWVLGMAARFASFLVLAAVMVATRAALPPLWMAAGYLGTLLVLLFAETRFLS
jgi:hypothetical protein